MKLERLLLVLFLALSLAACGGGGGGGVPPDDDPPPDTTDLRTQEMIQACLVAGYASFADWTAALNGVVTGSASSFGIILAPGGILLVEEMDFSSLTLIWLYDPTGGNPQQGGMFAFFDAADDEVQPFAPTDRDALVASQNLDTLGTILPNVPDGTRMNWAQQGPVEGLAQATVDVVFTGGVAASTSGDTTAALSTCNVAIGWTDIALADLQGDLAATFPTGTFTITVQEGGDTLTGTVTLDGTRTATASVQRNGGAVTTWDIDLVTGVATQTSP